MEKIIYGNLALLLLVKKFPALVSLLSQVLWVQSILLCRHRYLSDVFPKSFYNKNLVRIYHSLDAYHVTCKSHPSSFYHFKHRDPLEWHQLPTNYHENLPSCSKDISGGHIDTHTDKQTGDMISLLLFLGNRLKTFRVHIKKPLMLFSPVLLFLHRS
jgi:hypothetical protein